jgi:cell shape-determining protein MreC
MKTRFPFVILLFLLTSLNVSAQWVKFKKKDLAFLAKVDTVSVVITYNKLHFNADNLTEKEFLEHIAQKIRKHLSNTEAEEWETEYFKYKNERWPEAFVNALNETNSSVKNAPIFVLN